jgi:hypothetical protein
MRQSLSDQTSTRASSPGSAATVAVALALALAVLLAGAGLVDQLGGRTLMDHADEMYGRHGKQTSAGLMYGLLYTIAAVGAVLWLLVMRSVRTGSRWAAAYAAAVVVLGAGMAAAVLGAREYGEQIFPTLWGILALLSPAAGAIAVVQLLRRRTS